MYEMVSTVQYSGIVTPTITLASRLTSTVYNTLQDYWADSEVPYTHLRGSLCMKVAPLPCYGRPLSRFNTFLWLTPLSCCGT